MRASLLSILLTTVAAACSGCIIYPADSPFFSGGQVRSLDREMKDLKGTLDRGDITLDEYERQKAVLLASFDGGNVITRISRPLSEEETAEFRRHEGELEQGPHMAPTNIAHQTRNPPGATGGR